jgi:protein-L-isoaspartate(D-aspartate) O-methyltransferase
MDRNELIRQLRDERLVLQKPALLKAFEIYDRADFVPEDYKPEAYEDYALPIGFGQTISQPTTVAFMLELLDVSEGEHLLDVGSGSGWTTALLSNLAGESGSVIGVEIIPELVKFGRKNIEKYGIKNAKIYPAGDEVGNAKNGPYDKILVSAAADDAVPEELLMQLKPGGILVIPVDNSLFQIRKISEDDFQRREFPGFAFVELK